MKFKVFLSFAFLALAGFAYAGSSDNQSCSKDSEHACHCQKGDSCTCKKDGKSCQCKKDEKSDKKS